MSVPAQQAPAEAESSDIIVVGETGEGVRLTADSLRDAAKTFIKYRSTFAPNSALYLWAPGTRDELRFVLRRRKAGRDGTHESLPLELDSQERLALPVDLVRTGDWELRVRGAATAPRIRPRVASPGMNDDRMRFGDLRLNCRVSLAFARLGPAMRALAGAVGPCGSSRAAIYMGLGKAMERVDLDRPARQLELGREGMAVRLPLHDATIANDARVSITYR